MQQCECYDGNGAEAGDDEMWQREQKPKGDGRACMPHVVRDDETNRMRHAARLRSAVVRGCSIVVCVMLLAGCSGGGSKAHGLSPIAYARRADALCARYNALTARLHGRGSGVERLAQIAERTRVLLDGTVARLRAVPLPRGEESRAREWLASFERLHRDVVAIRDAARANDLAAVRRLALAAQRDDSRSNALARRLGMQACSSG